MFRRSTAFALFGTLGTCAASGAAYVYAAPSAATNKPAPEALSPSEFRPFKLVDVELHSPDTRRFRFSFPDPDMVSGVKTASCIVLKYTDEDGKDVIRPYTPVTTSTTEGYMDLIVKRYPNSKMGSHLFGMKRGQTVDMKGPFEKLAYTPNKYKHIGMIAGGTGITPMYQVMKEVAANSKDTTKVSLIYLCRSEEDVLLADELSKLGALKNFYVYVAVDKPKKGWMGGVGHITQDMVRNIIPAPGTKDSLVMVCGPPGMMSAVSGDKDFSSYPPKQGELKGMLKDIGYSPKEVFKF
eukprot:PhM_4_TR4803/c0_g1_i1/m.46038/K00326/E1.6.2.2; cytochrome-b5 reductase